MDKAIQYHLKKDILDKTRLVGGYTFDTWLLTLSGHQKVVFRTQVDYTTGGGRKVVIADLLAREKFFYDHVNQRAGRICPEVYTVDDTREHFPNAYSIMEYMEGTPLHLCINDLDEKEKNRVFYRIGEMAAQINSVQIAPDHPYITERAPWEAYIANRLRENFAPLVRSKVITQAEADTISNNMESKKAAKTLSFLHLDMRHVNMIYNNGEIYILDAANCEFGDPLFELAPIETGGELTPPVIEGYKNTCGEEIDLQCELYDYYKMEIYALVLDLFMHGVKDAGLTRFYLEKFNEVKKRLL